MNITANQVQKVSAGSRSINNELKSIMSTFQADILEAAKNGFTHVIISTPTNFNIVGMENKTAQTIIYHKLLEECESNGFNVKISMTPDRVTYHIRWDIARDDSDLKKMRANIASHIIQPSS